MRAVPDSADVDRVCSLPRRAWTPEESAELARSLTAILRTPDGGQTLRPIQAIALYELATSPGLFAPIRVGGGKTLISQLAATITKAKRPILLVPAHLKTKARQQEIEEMRKHWQIPPALRVESYQLLSTANSADMLEVFEPDLIIADECHYLKNRRAACTRRVRRYLDRVGTACRFVGMSGTATGRGLREYAHLCMWGLHAGSPAPLHWRAVEDWSLALDPFPEIGLGALRRLGDYHSRLVQTPGVVATSEDPLPIRLEVSAHIVQTPPNVEQAIRELRGTWETPDGHPIMDGATAWRHVQELALGYYNVWDPRPPEWWLDPRRAWASLCRETLSHNRRNLDTEKQLKDAVDAGLYPRLTAPLADWRAVEKEFTPNPVPVWISDHVVDRISEWLADGPGIVWTAHKALGERFGAMYYGAQGRNPAGQEIEHAEGPIVASIKANATGRNLQKWSRNLVASAPPDGSTWEQMIGRTHRDGQQSKIVTVDVLATCSESLRGLRNAIDWAGHTEELIGQAHKLSHAAVLDIPDTSPVMGAAWQGQG